MYEHLPRRYQAFRRRFPELSAAWEHTASVQKKGPLDEKSQRLIKLAVAAGALKKGAVQASVRKALEMGLPMEELFHVVALSAATIGFPSAVAVFAWVEEVLEARDEKRHDTGSPQQGA